MKKIIYFSAVSVFLLTLGGCSLFIKTAPEPNKTSLTEAEAKVIAETACIKGGESLAVGYYNEGTKTWWFDANLNSTAAGCNPACVVSEESKTAEINWRCTGLIIPEQTTSEIIKNLLVEKYPKYAGTLMVNISQETAGHARGTVVFETGAPGGYFLAAKLDGQWKIVLDGNGQIPCSLAQDYSFPTAMLADCAD